MARDRTGACVAFLSLIVSASAVVEPCSVGSATQHRPGANPQSEVIPMIAAQRIVGGDVPSVGL